MEKKQRKELELQLIGLVKQHLTKTNPIATSKINKVIKESSKTIAKKFNKAIAEIKKSRNPKKKVTAKKVVKKQTIRKVVKKKK